MNIPKYPQDFFDFTDGVEISNEEINNWIEKCINELEKDKQAESWSISSGNTYVQVYRGSEDFKYDIMVSKSHADALIFEEE